MVKTLYLLHMNFSEVQKMKEVITVHSLWSAFHFNTPDTFGVAGCLEVKQF
jgi:hypothetical protein